MLQQLARLVEVHEGVPAAEVHQGICQRISRYLVAEAARSHARRARRPPPPMETRPLVWALHHAAARRAMGPASETDADSTASSRRGVAHEEAWTQDEDSEDVAWRGLSQGEGVDSGAEGSGAEQRPGELEEGEGQPSHPTYMPMWEAGTPAPFPDAHEWAGHSGAWQSGPGPGRRSARAEEEARAWTRAPRERATRGGGRGHRGARRRGSQRGGRPEMVAPPARADPAGIGDSGDRGGPAPPSAARRPPTGLGVPAGAWAERAAGGQPDGGPRDGARQDGGAGERYAVLAPGGCAQAPLPGVASSWGAPADAAALPDAWVDGGWQGPGPCGAGARPPQEAWPPPAGQEFWRRGHSAGGAAVGGLVGLRG